MRTTSRGLTVWNNTSDPFDHTQLAANWDLIDSYWVGFDSATQMPKRITSVSSLPGSPAAGDLCLITVGIGDLPAYSVIRYDGTHWLPVGIVSIQSSLPSVPYAGQIVVLSSISGDFPAWSTVRFDGINWDYVGVFGVVDTGSSSGNIKGSQTSGDVFVNTSSRGLVLVDRITGLKYRVYVDSAALTLEAVT